MFCKSYHTKFEKTPILNGEEIDEFVREALALKYLNTWEVNTISPKIQYDRKELIKIFDEANNMLRGDGLRAGIERFGEFANILFLKLISESEDIKKLRGERSDFDDMCHWNYIKDLKPSLRIEHINKIVYEKLNLLYKTDIFTPLTIRDSAILKQIMNKLDPLTLTDVDSDVKGDAFEYFLKESTATKNDLGEYFTPRHIVKTMVKLVNPQIGEKVYDPFCGTGGFLIESFRHIWNTMPRNVTTEKMLREETIYGNEITNTARITKMNMILAGDGHSNIHMKDSLANPVDGLYDVVLANMPYSQKTNHGSLYSLPSTNGDSICVQHCMKAINATAENGRMAIVVPEGFLFRKNLEKTRELILKNCNVQSIISLPNGVFLPYTPVKTDIIYATKINQKLSSKEKRKDYWYFDVKSDGYSLDNHRRKLELNNDLDKYQEFRKLDNDQKKEMLDIGFELIPLSKVKSNSYILVGSRYREIEQINTRFEIISLGEILDLNCGARITKHANAGDKYPVYGGGGISFYTDEFTREDDYVISRFAMSENCVRYVKDKFYLLDSGFTFSIKSKYKDIISKEYIGQILLNFQDKIFTCGRGQAQKNIDFDMFSKIKIPLPPLFIQKQIAEELENYQRIIDGARSIVDSYKPVIPRKLECDMVKLETVVTFRPSKNEINHLPKDLKVSFLPMSDLNSHNISFIPKQERPIDDVYSGFTYFRNGDVLLAKITPCFENGKAGVAKDLVNSIGFGSTEYIVIRANTELVLPEWVFHNINSYDFIEKGKEFMNGTGGQQRLDINFVKNYNIKLPTLEKQHEILAQIEEEQKLIEPSKQLIEVFKKKIKYRINELFE